MRLFLITSAQLTSATLSVRGNFSLTQMEDSGFLQSDILPDAAHIKHQDREAAKAE